LRLFQPLIEAVHFISDSKRRSEDQARDLARQRKTRFTFHRYTKNPVLNKEKIQSNLMAKGCAPQFCFDDYKPHKVKGTKQVLVFLSFQI